MLSAKTTIINPQGMHARPAQVFVKAMAQFPCNVTILGNGKKINGKSIMNMMVSTLKQGTEIEIQCDGEKEQEALDAAIKLVESGLGDLETPA